MQKSILKLLPGAENLSARFAMLVLLCLLVALVLGLLALLETLHLSPVDMTDAFPWVVMALSLVLLVTVYLLWCVISFDVLRPLTQLAVIASEEERGGLGQVVATMREMRDAIDRAHAELDESHKNLRQVEKLAMVGKLAAGVAHSVRNPLTSVNLRLFSLSRGLELTPRQQEDFKVISDAVRHIDTILGNFLEFSRRPRLKLSDLNPGAVVDESLKLLENRLASFPVTVTVTLINELPQVLADPDQLREAVLNILLNACEAMEYNGSLEIEEYVAPINSQPFVHIAIQDSGPGIAEDHLGEIFVPFFSTKDQGTGLGLPIAKGILEEHGGDIFVRSEEDKGTRFILVLPVSS